MMISSAPAPSAPITPTNQSSTATPIQSGTTAPVQSGALVSCPTGCVPKHCPAPTGPILCCKNNSVCYF
jgi:hypothetical protein